MKKILLVFGTRPEAIKMAPLVNKFKEYTSDFQTIVCVTGQHRQMLDSVLKLFDIVPDYDLDIMKPGQDLYDITSRVILGMRDVLRVSQPDIVFVHGDTTTSMAAAMAAFYSQIPVAHVEAGLRTYNIYSPWPEEINRQITGRIARWHLSPTEISKHNLLKENVLADNIFVTGNTVIDALLWVNNKIINDKALSDSLTRQISNIGYDICRLQDGKRLILITGHRRENFGEGFLNICMSIKELAKKYTNVDFVYPMHLNPNVRKPIKEIFGDIDSHQGRAADNIYLMGKSHLLLTDSGGVQEEAPGLGKPVLVMRDTTERPEAVEAGTVALVGTDRQCIVDKVSSLLDDESIYRAMSKARNPYGDGKACSRIVDLFRNLT